MVTINKHNPIIASGEVTLASGVASFPNPFGIGVDVDVQTTIRADAASEVDDVCTTTSFEISNGIITISGWKATDDDNTSTIAATGSPVVGVLVIAK